MIVFTYDGSFEGFLTCVYESYYVKRPNKIIKLKNYHASFLEENIYIETNEEKYYKVYKSIKEKLGGSILRKIYLSQLCDIEEGETAIFIYIELAFKIGPKVELYKHNHFVDKVNKLESKVNNEAHRFKGFVRFKDIGGVLYSKINSDNDILEMIMGHFINRFSNENFIIHDEKRNKAIIYDGHNGSVVFDINEKINSIKDIDKGDLYEKLWVEYFRSTTIKERVNPRLQKQMMPRRYWDNLIEIKPSKEN